MIITETRIKLEPLGHSLLGFATITLDGVFVVHELKVIDSNHGPFIAMPSRKMSDHCPRCGSRNHLRAQFCNECGLRLDPTRTVSRMGDEQKLHVDVCHPIDQTTRAAMERVIVGAYEAERENVVKR